MRYKYKYTGLFVDFKELWEIMEQITDEKLKFPVEHPHVTIDYHPEHVDASLFGKKVLIKITGYANDGRNQGLKVELADCPPKIGNRIEEKKLLHITCSLSRSAKAVNTKDLLFTPLDREYYIEGVYQGFSVSQVTNRYLCSFYIDLKNRLPREEELNFEKKELKLRYLSKYIQRIYDVNNNICRIYRLKEDKVTELEGTLKKCVPKELQRALCWAEKDPVTIILFATGSGFACFDIEIIEPLFSRNYLDINNRLARMYNQDTSLFDQLGSLLSAEKIGQVEWFPLSNNKKAYTFHNLYLDEDKTFAAVRAKHDQHLAVLLKSWQINSQGSLSDDNLYEIDSRHGWIIDGTGIISYATEEKTNSHDVFLRKTYYANANNDYFWAYILALHEKDCLQKYTDDILSSWDDENNLIHLRENLLRFDLWFSYNVISMEDYYQRYYNKLHEKLYLSSLEKEIEEVLEKVEAFANSKKDRRINSLLTCVTFLTVFSVLTDGLGFVDRILEWQTLTPLHWMFIIIILFVLFFVLRIIMRRK